MPRPAFGYGEDGAAPTEEDLLVLYLGGEADEDVIGRLPAPVRD